MIYHEVYLTDRGLNYDQGELFFIRVDAWARKHCTSYIGFDVLDVSDLSYVYDRLATYAFNEEKDVILFKLKWE